MKVTFDGPNKLIIATPGTIELDVKSDIYSSWKEWLTIGNNMCYLPALSAIGGDPISETLTLGSTFFLENGWKIRPYEGDHSLTITGNIYTRDGSSPIVKTIGDYNVTVSMSRSNIVDTVNGGGGGASVDPNVIAAAVWDKFLEGQRMSEILKKISDNVEDTQALVIAGL